MAVPDPNWMNLRASHFSKWTKESKNHGPENAFKIRTTSLFSQLLDLSSRNQFQNVVKAHQAERLMKGFTCWEQFVVMLFCQLTQAHSLREICDEIQCCLVKLIHVHTPPQHPVPVQLKFRLCILGWQTQATATWVALSGSNPY